MSRRESRDWIPLEGLTDEQLAILVKDVGDWLSVKAADLPEVCDDERSRGEAEEVAALGRLLTGLRRGQVLPDDGMARKLAARTVTETNTLDGLRAEYRRVLDEHEAWAALLARFDPSR